MTTHTNGEGTERSAAAAEVTSPAEHAAPPAAPAEVSELIDPVDGAGVSAVGDGEVVGDGEAGEAAEPVAAESGEDGGGSEDSDPTEDSDPAEDSGLAEALPESTKKSRKQLLEAEGDVAADFLEGLLDICDIDGDIDVDIDGDRAAVSIVDSEEGRVPRRLVGPEGKVLESLQELTRLAVQSETGERSRLMLDVAGHRAARRAEIVEIARGVIAEATAKGEQIEMDPMTAFERKIVHDEVLAAGLRSESDGVEPRRFVVVLPSS